MRFPIAIITAVMLIATSCGDDGSGSVFGPDVPADEGPGGSAGSLTADIEPCSLLTEAEIVAVFGAPYEPEESEPAGPFTSCSWGTGEVLVSLATTDEPIIAPGVEDCPSAELGDQSFACEGRVTVLVGGIQFSVTTIDAFVEDAQLATAAGIVLLKLSGPG